MFSKYFYCFSKNKGGKDARVFDQTSLADVAEQYPKKIIQYSDSQPFIPPITNGQVIKVYDGDTFTLAAYLPYNESPLYRFSVRLRGIDTPEIKGGTEEEKSAAVLARTELSNMIMNKSVVLTNIGTEKYGRILADVYVEGVHVNQHMLDTKLALPYDGGLKIGFSPFQKGGFERV